MKNIMYTTLFVLGITFVVNAQNLNSHYRYQMNWFNINPAITGETEGIKVMINPGTQWVGMEGNPTNTMFGIHTATKNNMGVGLKIIMDKRGYFSNTTAEFNYAYKLKLDDEKTISFGITAGLYQSKLDMHEIMNNEYNDETDPSLNASLYDQKQFLSGFGAFYTMKNWEIGVSIPHLVVSERSMSDHIFGMVRYAYSIPNSDFVVKPTIVHQNLTNSPSITDIGFLGEWDKMVWLQYAYRTNKTNIIGVGFKKSNFRVGYAYTISTGELSDVTSGSYELLFAVTFGKTPVKKGIKDRIIVSPKL